MLTSGTRESGGLQDLLVFANSREHLIVLIPYTIFSLSNPRIGLRLGMLLLYKLLSRRFSKLLKFMVRLFVAYSVELFSRCVDVYSTWPSVVDAAPMELG